MRETVFILITLSSIQSLNAQIQLFPIPRTEKEQKVAAAARTKDIELTLPFWDDFSFNTTSFPLDSLWKLGQSVWVNDGLGINPPSLKVATFDGLDSLGTPYSVNDVLAKGFADRLISQVIRLDQVDAALRPTVYISFFYQMKGRGEIPDEGDALSLAFKNSNLKWETVWTQENDGTLLPDQFYQVILPVDEKFFHDKFQFRFQNFARLSGPYDTWHVDYVYLDASRTATDLTYPDRSVAASLGPILGTYRSIPFKHFQSIGSTVNSTTFPIYNLCEEETQPISFSSWVDIETYKGEDSTLEEVALEDGSNNALAVLPLTRRDFELVVLPSPSNFDEMADSVDLKFRIIIDSDDETNEPNAVCNPGRYPQIDFRTNDSISSLVRISSYYAYDDGSAEYGAGLNQAGAQLAYEFSRIGSVQDTIVALDLYFPRFGSETSTLIDLRIWDVLSNDIDAKPLHSEQVTLQHNEQNMFWRRKLSEPVKVGSTFYIGWKQSSAIVVAAGLDKNTDSGSKMFYNTTGSWVQNTQLTGSLMVRPVFGKGRAGVISGVEDESTFTVYPNPSDGTFFFQGHADQITVYDLAGRNFSFSEERYTDHTQVRLTNRAAGLYVIKVLRDGAVKTTKLRVLP